MSNVLVLSAGRRVDLVLSFIEEVKQRNLSSLVFTVDSDPFYSAACQISDGFFQAPRVTDSSYIPFIRNLCQRLDISLIVPTIDTELEVLSVSRNDFLALGINIVISDSDFVIDCTDKRRTALLFQLIGISSPRIYSSQDLSFPCFVKPHNGSCSVGATAVYHSDQLTDSLLHDKNMMFMEFVSSDYNEYTVDAYFDSNHNLRCLVPRHRLEVRAGEVSKAVTRMDLVYNFLLPKVKYLKGARGCITMQLFANENTLDFKALEINPRFGGGYPLSHAAGANFVGWLIDEYILKKDIPFFDQWDDRLIMLRYDSKVLVKSDI